MLMFKNGFIPFHLVEKSYWPLCSSSSVFGLLGGSVYCWHYGFSLLPYMCFMLLMLVSFLWWGDVKKESFNGSHSESVTYGLRLGMLLFILSEVFFFFSFFWSFFHSCWGSGVEMGWKWPPLEFKKIMIDPFSVPFLNTVMLLSSGISITWSHHMFMSQDFVSCAVSLGLTVGLGFYFLVLQVCEYSLTSLSMKAYVYGTVFFLLTGFHGMHVTVGAVFLGVCLMRLLSLDFNSEVHVGFECAAWYWHFVDVVWMFLFFFLYWYSFTL